MVKALVNAMLPSFLFLFATMEKLRATRAVARAAPSPRRCAPAARRAVLPSAVRVSVVAGNGAFAFSERRLPEMAHVPAALCRAGERSEFDGGARRDNVRNSMARAGSGSAPWGREECLLQHAKEATREEPVRKMRETVKPRCRTRMPRRRGRRSGTCRGAANAKRAGATKRRPCVSPAARRFAGAQVPYADEGVVRCRVVTASRV